MRIFNKKNGGIVQLIDKEKLREWPTELPLLFVEYIRSNQLENYEDTQVKKQVESYLDEIMKDVAIPKFINVLEGEEVEKSISALTRLEELSKKKIEMVSPIKPYLEKLQKNKNKEVVKLAKNISNNFQKAERKKELAKKRKIMQQKEKDFLAGKLNGDEYAKARKDYLILKE